MTFPIDLNRKENYLVKASLVFRDAQLDGVPCKIYLPERIHERPYVILKPSKEDVDRIMASFDWALTATVHGFDGRVETTIYAPQVYFSRASTTHWGKDISETTIPGEPQDLHVVYHLQGGLSKSATHVTFWITENRFLTPFMICENSYTGEVKCERVSNVEFTIKDGLRLMFEKHFQYRTEENQDLVRWSFLAACTELRIPANDASTLKRRILTDIDDFLLVASLAARRRTACLGWAASDTNCCAKFYRGNYASPLQHEDSNVENGIIDISDFQGFTKVCYPAFLSFQNKLALRSSICAVVPFEPRTLESSFLSMFAGLETLVLDFRRRERLEFVLEETAWTDLKRYLKDCIKKSTEPRLDREQRASIYRKLGELNRVSLSEAFDQFCKSYSIDLADLWPVFAERGAIGLNDIRNKLIHGDPFPQDLISPLSIANEHLQYTLERVIIRVLGWDVSKTRINPAYLRANLCAIGELPAAEARLSGYIRNEGAVKERVCEEEAP